MACFSFYVRMVLGENGESLQWFAFTFQKIFLIVLAETCNQAIIIQPFGEDVGAFLEDQPLQSFICPVPC